MKRTVKDLVGLKGKVVLLRVDFNVPMDDFGRIRDDSRIINALPTIRYLINQKAKVVLLSHLGRPNGYDTRKSLWPITFILMNKLKCNVSFCNKVIGDEVKERVANMREGTVLLLENVRFYPEEEANDLKFAKKIAELGDIYINDAFGAAHRKNASTYALARIMPNAIGLLMEREIRNLSIVTETALHPFVAVFGGAKVDTKIETIKKLLKKADKILIGGAMAYTFMYAQGEKVGSSKVDYEYVDLAREILQEAKQMGKTILLPVDHVCVSSSDKRKTAFKTKELKGDFVGYDIGDRTINLFSKEIAKAKQIFWNGPMGMFEKEEFLQGTVEIANAIASSRGYSIVGGGDTISAIKKSGVLHKISFVSTGGGAAMEFIEKGTLPCIEVIQEKIF